MALLSQDIDAEFLKPLKHDGLDVSILIDCDRRRVAGWNVLSESSSYASPFFTFSRLQAAQRTTTRTRRSKAIQACAGKLDSSLINSELKFSDARPSCQPRTRLRRNLLLDFLRRRDSLSVSQPRDIHSMVRFFASQLLHRFWPCQLPTDALLNFLPSYHPATQLPSLTRQDRLLFFSKFGLRTAVRIIRALSRTSYSTARVLTWSSSSRCVPSTGSRGSFDLLEGAAVERAITVLDGAVAHM
ncbi:hypothetical protein B0H13DRAFT_1864272 [Mycena leptocephala]|nr:hypothetical protein B0H13DRAFT_1864272 [Mycena leptocephala]